MRTMRAYLDGHNGVCWFVFHPVHAAISPSPDLNLLQQVVCTTLKRLERAEESD